MITIGQEFPKFSKKAVVSIEKGKEFETINSDYFANEDNVWTVMFWWPKDFTFVCPTELHAFQEKMEEFEKRNAQVVGCSVDSCYTHLAWLNTPKNKGGIEGIEYPLVNGYRPNPFFHTRLSRIVL